MTRVLLDVNILLDVFLDRDPWAADAAGVLQSHFDGRIVAHVSAASLPTLYYIMRRGAGHVRVHAALGQRLGQLVILPVDSAAADAAFAMAGGDFEDNLQIACALHAGLNFIVSRDATGFAASSIPVCTPPALLAVIAAAS